MYNSPLWVKRHSDCCKNCKKFYIYIYLTSAQSTSIHNMVIWGTQLSLWAHKSLPPAVYTYCLQRAANHMKACLNGEDGS